MASVLGDLWQILDKQTYLGQQVLNRYYYRVTSITGLANSAYAEVADWFVSHIVDVIDIEQHGLLNHYEIEIRNLSNGIDIFSLPIDEDGEASSDASTALPSYVSLGFKLVRESLVTRNGYKRFAGLVESKVSGNNYTFNTGAQAAIEAALAEDVIIGAVTLLEPVIVKTPLGNPPVATYQYSSVGAAQFVALGTQNTRKAGRGV